MKKLYLLLTFMCFFIVLKAQVSKTVEVTAGNLSALLTSAEQNTITDLTLTGTIDARDFKTMRDHMPELVLLDMSEAVIMPYTGTDGTGLYSSNEVTYYANSIPQTAFFSFDLSPNTTLTSVKIPLNTQRIEGSAFARCQALNGFTIPSSVYWIDSGAFSDCVGLTSITIPPSVTTLGFGCFHGCTGLTSLVIPPSVTVITEYLLKGCSGLLSVQLPSTVTIIENWAFAECSALVSINIPETMASIGNYAFLGCSSIESLAIPPAVTFIGESAFDGCSNWKGSLNLPQGLKNIKAFAFRNCSSLTYVQLPSMLDTISVSAFDGCSEWSGALTLPATLKLIGTRAFYNCSKLTGALTFPESVAYIGIRAFSGCSALSGELIIPPLVKTVEDHSFAGCSGFSSLTIPPTVQFINSGAFSGCSGLTTINAQPVVPVALNDVTDVFEGVDKSATLHVPYGSKEAYTAADGWNEFTTITEDTQGLLLGATKLSFSPEGGSNSTINLEASVAWTASSDQSWLSVNPSSGNNTQTLTLTAEANQTNAYRTGKIIVTASGVASQMIHVTQESNPVVIQSTAGHLWEAITEEQRQTITHLVITGTMNAPDFGFLSSMPLLAKLDMSGVTITPYHMEIMRYDVYFPENVIPGTQGGFNTGYSMSKMTSLTSIILPSSITGISANAFEGCTSLTTIEIPPSVISMGDYVFKDCKALTSLKIPSSVVDFGYGVFSGCSRLASVELPEGITALNGTFASCTSLRNIKLPVSLTEIGNETFLNCSSLTRIEIPPMVTSIGTAAFSGCTALSAISLSPSLKLIGYYAFSGCIGLTSVTIPSAVTYIAPGAFGGCRSLETIYAFPVQPPQKEDPGYEDAFTWVDKVNCLLYVPIGSKEFYEQADDWKGFKTILEMESLSLSANYLIMEAESSTVSVEVTSANAWTATSDQPWLTITPASGTGNSTVTLSLTANPTVVKRMAIATFTAGNQAPQLISVVQQGNTATIELTAGNLNSTFTAVELKGIQSLSVKGTMDARDFKTIRDKMNTLTELDLSEVTVLAYSGTEGTRNSQYDESGDTIVESFDYPANEVPPLAFYGNCKLITSVKLPNSITSIGTNAFTQRTLLTEVAIPSTVSYIGLGAFAECTSLTSVTLPPRLTQISHSLFYQSGLTSINIPSKVSSIEHTAFGNCASLTSIHSDALFPPELTSKYSGVQVFFALDKSKCTLYVPYESGELYAMAPNEWNEFTNIVEMPGFRLSAVTTAMKASQGDTASVSIKSNLPWTVTSDQSWLTIQSTSGTGNGRLHFTAEANTMAAGRMAIVTVTATDVSPQTITVIQQGASSTVKLTPGSLASAFTVEKLNGITDLILTGEMDARDFRVLRDQMPLLTTLDLSAVTIKEYKETDPLTKVLTTYREKAIPGMAFFDPQKWIGKSSLTAVVLPVSLEKIGNRAFSNATGLREISIPATVKFIDYNTFNNCPYLRTIISHMQTPPGSYDYGISFYNVDKTACKLYVPKGSKELYAAAKMWKDFTNMVEMGGFYLSATELTMEVVPAIQTIQITTEGKWSAVSDKEWLIVSPSSGDSTQTVTFTCQENTSFDSRTAIVTFSDGNNYSQVVTITQHGLVTGMDEMTSLMEIKSYPNPFTQQMAIEIANPSHKEVSVEIYSISGQRIKTLAKAQKGANISLSWDGSDEQGKKVPEGMYLLKVNEQTRKVMKR